MKKLLELDNVSDNDTEKLVMSGHSSEDGRCRPGDRFDADPNTYSNTMC